MKRNRLAELNWQCCLAGHYGNTGCGGIKLERFLPKNQHTQSKLLNFENWVMRSGQKLGIILESKVI